MILWYFNHKPGGLIWAIFFTVRNTNLINTHDYKVETWNAAYVTVNSYSYTRTVIGVYVVAEVQTLSTLTSGSEAPFLVIDRPLGADFSPYISNLLNGDGIIFPHTSYSYASVLRAHKDIAAGIYYVSMFMPYK